MRQTLGYTETLKRGYAVVRGDGAVVTTTTAAAKASALEIEFADGRLLGRRRQPAKGQTKAREPAGTGPAPLIIICRKVSSGVNPGSCPGEGADSPLSPDIGSQANKRLAVWPGLIKLPAIRIIGEFRA